MKNTSIKKRILGILLSGLLLANITGCGNAGTVNTNQNAIIELGNIQTIHFSQKISKYVADIDSDTDELQDGYEEYVDTGVLFLPASYHKDGEKTRLVIACHGSGTTIDENFDLKSKNYVETLVKSGYAVLDVNGGVEDGRHFGASFAIQSYVKAYHWAISNYNLYEEVFLFGASMGGLTSFTLTQSGAIPVIAQAAFCPVVDLYRQAWMFPWYSEEDDYSVQRERIAEYYDFDNYESFESGTEQKASENDMKYFIDNIDRVYGYDPILNGCINGEQTLTVDTNNYSDAYSELVKLHNVPLKIWHADDDKMVHSEFSEYIVNAIKKSGGIAYYRPFPTGGHTPNLGNEVTMYDEKKMPYTTYVSEYELVQWFDRWN